MPGAEKLTPGAVEMAVMSALREAMTAQRLQQTEVAARVGVSTSQLSRIMSGKRPASFTEVVHLAEVLGVNLPATVRAAEQKPARRGVRATAARRKTTPTGDVRHESEPAPSGCP